GSRRCRRIPRLSACLLGQRRFDRRRRSPRKEQSVMLESFTDWVFKHLVIEVLLFAGLWLTVRTSFVQVRRFGEAWRVAFVRRAVGPTGVLTPFQAFMTALGASIGTGNIAGVATAIVSGGPAALFWIWVYGFLAMAIKFA